MGISMAVEKVWHGAAKEYPIVVQECLSQKLNDSGVYTTRK